MSKRLLYLEDLYNFYSNTYKRSTHFDAQKTGEPIVVHVHGKVNFEQSDKDTEGLCPVHLQSCHTELNVNGSHISESVMNAALPSFSNRPILGYIHKVNGQWEFYSHNMHEDENGEVVYDEKPIGIIPESCNAKLVYDEEKGKTYCEVDGYLFEEYSKAAEIVQREEECAVSVELSIRSLSYNAKAKYLDIEDFFFSGVTILGKTPEGEIVKPGMENSNIKLTDFSVENNSVKFDKDAKLIELLEDLNKTISNFNKEQNSKEGGDKENMNKFEELCQKYGKSADDITFNYENMTDEELETKFSEMFDGEGEAAGDDAAANSDGQTAGGSSTEVVDTNAEGSSGTGSTDENTSTDPNPDETTDDNTEGTTPEDPDNFPKKQTMQRTFEVPHDDIRYALYTLLQPYEEADNAWYWIVDVYDSYFVYEGSGKYYGQKYSVEEDNVAFNEERYELFAEFLTASEKAALSDMRANYTALKEFKEDTEKNELHEQREKILADQKFESVAKTDAFKELVRNMDNYSLEDLEKEAKIVFADNVELISNSDAKSGVKIFANVNKNSKPKKRYGNLFD